MNIYRNPKQLKAFDAFLDPSVKEIFFGGAAGGGKSWLISDIAIHVLSLAKGARAFVGRVNISDSRESFCITFRKVAETLGFYGYKITPNGIKFSNGSEIVLLDLQYYPYKDPNFDNLGSKEFTIGFIEEAGNTNRKAFEVLKSRVGRHLNKEYGIPPKILVTFNPSPNWLYSYIYERVQSDSLPDHIKYIYASVDDNDRIDPEYVEMLNSIEDDSLRRRLRHGDWNFFKNDLNIFDPESILSSFTNSYVLPIGERRITADIAMQGSDRMVVCVWHGKVLEELVVVEKSDGKGVVEIILRLAQKNAVQVKNIAYDGDGVGAYLGGYLRGAIEVRGNAAPYSQPLGRSKYLPNYTNLRAQLAFSFSKMISSGDVYLKAIPENLRNEVMRELMSFESDERSGKIGVTPKDKIRGIIGKSPDIADALIMFSVFSHLDIKINRQRRISAGSF